MEGPCAVAVDGPLGERNDCLYIRVYKLGLCDRLRRRVLTGSPAPPYISRLCISCFFCSYHCALFGSSLGLYGAPYNAYADYDALGE